MKKGYVLGYMLLILLLVGSFLAETTHAQVGEKGTGYVVMAEGDTLYGALKPLGKRRRSLAIRFRQRGADAYAEYTPHDLAVYVLDDGTRYESRQIAESLAGQQRFLQLLVDGYTRLYYLRDVNGTELFYLEKEAGQLTPLREQSAVGTLSTLFSDCVSLDDLSDRQKRETYQFTVRDMMDNVTAYNECVRPDVENTAYKSFDKLTVRPGFRLGVNMTEVAFQNPDRRVLRQDFSSESGFLVGVFLHIGPKGRRSSISAQPEVLLNSKRSSASRPCIGDPTCIEGADITLTTLQASLLLRYKVYANAIQFSATAGPMADFVLSDQSESYRESLHQQSRSTFKYADWSFGFVVGAGIQYRDRYNIEARWVEGKGVVGGLDEETTEQVLQFTIGFIL